MTTLYRPVLIETRAQIEALPVGASAVHIYDEVHRVAVKIAPDTWEVTGEEILARDLYMLDGFWTALVPIEVSVQGHTIYEGARTIEATYYVHTDEES